MESSSEIRSRWGHAWRLVLAVAVCQSAGLLGVLVTETGDGSWYQALSRPAFTPPGWLFGPVWTLLYTLMGFALYLLWRRRSVPGAGLALGLFAFQLVLNAAWTPLFFGAHELVAASVLIVVLWLAIAATIGAAWRVRSAAGMLLLPYLAWVGYAAVLTITIARMNP